MIGSCHPAGLADFFFLFNQFFPSAFFEVFSYRFASSCPEFYSCNVFSVIVVLIAASCTEMVSGGASLCYLESLYGTECGSVVHGYFGGGIQSLGPGKQALVRLKLPVFSNVLQAKFHLITHNKILNFFCQYNPIFIFYCE